MSTELKFYFTCGHGNTRLPEIRLLMRIPSLNVNWANQGEFNRTGLHIACKLGEQEVVKDLLAHPDIDVNKQDRDGCTPFFLACQSGKVEVVKMLLRDRRVETALADVDGCTPVWSAGKCGKVEILKWMIASGRELDVGRKGKMGGRVMTPSEAAADRKQPEAAGLIERFVANEAAVRAEMRELLGVIEFPVITPPKMTMEAYFGFLEGHMITSESFLAKILGMSLSVYATSVPEEFTDWKTITSLSLEKSGLTTLPPEIGQCESLQTLNLSSNPLNNEVYPVITHLLRRNPDLHTLDVSNLLMDPSDALSLIQALVWRFTNGLLSLRRIEIDDFTLPNFDGLMMIPYDILRQGTKKIVQHLLDLFRSPEAEPLFRTKVMTVGFESVGKTTILDALFPLKGWLISLGTFRETPYWYVFQGNQLTKYQNPTDTVPHKNRIVQLENRQWDVVVDKERENTIHMVPRKKNPSADREFAFVCPDKATFEIWLTRLKRVCMNEATHGIEIQTVQVDPQLTRDHFQHLGLQEGHAQLELTLWDFAGQHDYYHNHQYFISTRTIFMVLWKMSEQEKGLKGLEFWFRSLASRLPPSADTNLFSIIVIGTFLDHPAVEPGENSKRQAMIQNIAIMAGLKANIPCFEVSCHTLENIAEVQTVLVNTALSHSYMGERVPMKYLSIERYLLESREHATIKQEIPVMNITSLTRHFGGDEELVKRALFLLSQWGVCMHQSSPPNLAKLVILDPKFLAKGILADLFNHDPNIRAKRKNGVVRHADLVHIWKRFSVAKATADFSNLAVDFVALLETLGVCFVVEEDRQKPFMEQRSIIPALLPEKPADPFPYEDGYPSKFQVAWPKDPPLARSIQIERVLKFNVVPMELVSWVLVHLHPHIQNNLVWKSEVVVMVEELENTQGWIRVEPDKNRFIVILRGKKVKECCRLMDFIISRVKEVVGERFPSLSWVEKIRSPHYQECEIGLGPEITKEASLPIDQRTLCCPGTLLPIRAEMLLHSAGLLETRPEPIPPWWHFISKEASGSILTRVFENEEVLNQALFDRFSVLLAHASGDQQQVRKVYAVNNPHLMQAFDIKRNAITAQHHDTSTLFRKETWRDTRDAPMRERFMKNMAKKIAAFRGEFNDGTQTFAVPMVHGTEEIPAFQVLKNGFSPVSAVDGGFFGRGIYFTSDLNYADMYAKEIAPGSRTKVFLMTMVLPGNAYPVTEHPHSKAVSLHGQACKPGYQSHYTVVNCSDILAAFPTTNPDFDEEGSGMETADELVAFESAQALPLFLVYYETKRVLPVDDRTKKEPQPKGPKDPVPETKPGETVEMFLEIKASALAKPVETNAELSNNWEEINGDELTTLRSEVAKLREENSRTKELLAENDQLKEELRRCQLDIEQLKLALQDAGKH